MHQKNILRQIFVKSLWWLGWVPIAEVLKPLSRYPLSGKLIKHIPIVGRFHSPIGAVSVEYVGNRRDLIGRDIFWGGLSNYEPGTMNLLLSYVDDNTLFIDVGANTGIYSALALALGAKRVIAFEPIPEIFCSLIENLKANGDSQRFLALNSAVSYKDGYTEFHVPDGPVFPTSGSFHPKGFRGVQGRLIAVQTQSLDSTMESNGVDLTGYHTIIIKIDVEGFEADVVKGMKEIISTGRAVIIFECHPDGPIAELRALLEKYDYKVSHIDDDGLHELDYLDVSYSHSNQWNFVGFPRIFIHNNYSY